MTREADRAGGPGSGRQRGCFLDSADGDRLYPIYHLIAFTGLRRGEACGLHWADLDLPSQTLTVRWQLLQYGWETDLDDPKTDASADVMPLDTATAAVLPQHRDRQHAERLAAGPDWTDTGLVFTTPPPDEGTGSRPLRTRLTIIRVKLSWP